MKKIIAILLALALVSMAFAQSVSVTNTVKTNPTISISGLTDKDWYWSFDPVLSETVGGDATTADGRAKIGGEITFNLNWVERNNNNNILSFSPRWKISNGGPSFGALLKPIDHLELYVTNNWRASKSVAGPGIAWNNCNFAGYAGLTKPVSIGSGMNNYGGLYAVYNLLDDNLWIGGGLSLGTAWFKKGAYGPFQAGINFKVTDDVSIGARWDGQFGGYNENAPDNKGKGDTDKKYQKHGFYVGANLNFLQDAKVGTKLGVGFSFETEKASTIMNKKKSSAFAGTVEAGFDFRNSITDTLAVTVGWRNFDGTKTKVLPFYVGNTLNYKVSDDASFKLVTSYTQGSLPKAKKTYSDGVVMKYDNDAVMTTMNGSSAYIGLVHIYPEFSFKLGGKHTFTFGVETDVLNDMRHWNKTEKDWAYTTLRGVAARVAMPISWSYSF